MQIAPELLDQLLACDGLDFGPCSVVRSARELNGGLRYTKNAPSRDILTSRPELKLLRMWRVRPKGRGSVRSQSTAKGVPPDSVLAGLSSMRRSASKMRMYARIMVGRTTVAEWPSRQTSPWRSTRRVRGSAWAAARQVIASREGWGGLSVEV